MKSLTRWMGATLFVIMNASTSALALDASAGQVLYAIGETKAQDSAGGLRNLARGDWVAQGDRLMTGDGRLQIRLRDGALIAMQPNSDFQLETYAFNGAADGSESAVFSLLRGGIRAATGLIGHANRDRYTLRTRWGTIGIRGTTYKARICQGDCAVPDGLYAKGGEGVIVVANGAGELELSMGERAFVGAPDAAPVRTDVEPDIEDVPPPLAVLPTGPVTDTSFIGGQAVFQASISGVAQTLPLRAGAGAASGTIAITGTGEVAGTDIDGFSKSGAAQGAGSFSGIDSEVDVLNGAFNDRGGLIGASGNRVNDDGKLESAALFVTNVVDVHSDGVLYIGRWTDGTVTAFADGGKSGRLELSKQTSAHYAVALSEVTLPANGTAHYDFNGMATSSTGTDGSIGRGSTEGRIDVAFGSEQVDAAFKVDHDGIMNVRTSGEFDQEPAFSTSGSATGAGCSPSCAVDANGFVAGRLAVPERLGISYHIEQAQRGIVGVGGFSRRGTE